MEDRRLKMAKTPLPPIAGGNENAPKGAANFFVHPRARYAQVSFLQRANVGVGA